MGAVQAGACATRSAAQGVALTAQARPAATLGFRLAGLGFVPPGRPLGGRRERWPRPQPAQAARGLRLEREDGDGAGWAGGGKRSQGAARSEWKATQEPAT